MKNFNHGHFPPGIWRRILFIMNLKLVILLCTVGSLAASPSFSQQKKIDVSYRNESLASVFNDLKARTGYEFFFQKGVIPETHVTLSRHNATLEEIIGELLPQHGLAYVIHGNVVVISQKSSASQQPARQVPSAVTGTVKDAKRAPMVGVTIVVKGTNAGASSDKDGKFTIPGINLASKPVLIVSYVGYVTQEIPLVSLAPVNVVLQEEAVNVDEVVVTGYFQKPKQSITGSEVVVTGKELRQVGSLNFMNALAVFDPSVRPIPNNEYGSDPNRVPEVVIRGENGFDLRSAADDSRSNPNSPLYILDGVEVSATRVYDLDMNRIEAFSILKDASATALYGSRGANGVILIQTVRPREGEIRVTLNANYNFSFPDLRDYNLMNASEKLDFEKLAGLYTAAWLTGATQDELDYRYNSKLAEIARGVDTYWLSRPLRTAVNQRYSAFIEGGDSRFKYGIDLTYDNDKGVMKGSDRNNIGANFNFSYNIGNKLRVINDISVDNVGAENSPYGMFEEYAKMNPYERLYDPQTGEMNRRFGNGDAQDILNPLVNATLPNYDRTKYTEIKDNLSLEWRITDHFLVRGRAGITQNIQKSEAYLSPFSTHFDTKEKAEDRGSYTTFNQKQFDFDGDIIAQYSNVFAEKYSLSVGVGSNITTMNLAGDGYTATGFLNDKMNFVQYAQKFLKDSRPTGAFDKMRLIGYFTNVNVGYDNRYFIDASYRTDGSSRFGRESRFAPFWSVGFAWNVDREKWLDMGGTLKIRGSVGSTGSVNFAPDQAITKYVYDPANEYNGYNGATLSGYGNPALKWQNTLQYNAGFDLAMLQNFIVLNCDVYLKKTQNLLLDIDVAPSTGFLKYKENMGSIENRGVEARMRFNLIRNRAQDIAWSITLSAAANRNKILSLSNALEAMNEEANKLENVVSAAPYRNYQVGRSQSALMVVRSGGIDPATGNEVYIKLNGERTFDYDPRDKVYIGDTNPKIQGNFQTNFSFKGFDLFLAINYEYGGVLYNSTLATKVEGTVIENTETGVRLKGLDPKYNADKRALYERWKKPGDIAMYRRIDDQSPTYQSSRLVQDDDFINLQSLSLSYDVPRSMLKNMFIERMRFIFATTDLLRISTIKMERGTKYPFAQTFSLGANITF